MKHGVEETMMGTLAGVLEKTAIASFVIIMQQLVSKALPKLDGIDLPGIDQQPRQRGGRVVYQQPQPAAQEVQPRQQPQYQQDGLNFGDKPKSNQQAESILSLYR